MAFKKPIISATIKILQEAEGHVVTVELINNETFRGILSHSEVNILAPLHSVLKQTYHGK